KKRASQGMTAAIILIAFIITAAGIAFVILTMGSTMQQQLGTIGDSGSEAASSALQIEGGHIVGYSALYGNNDMDAFTFRLKVVLESGEVDLDNDALEIFVIVAHHDQVRLIENATFASEDNFCDTTNSTLIGGDYFKVSFTDADSDEILEPGEIAKFFIQLNANPVSPNEEITIVIISGVAMMKITKTMPTGIDMGSNIIK
ncbi:MAG: hypothetical protein GY870_20730, partial [archaeon]|nr:hypothetical protein [archaeon]